MLWELSIIILAIQYFRYRGKYNVSKLQNGESHELTLYYLKRKENYGIVTLAILIVYVLVIFVLFI